MGQLCAASEPIHRHCMTHMPNLSSIERIFEYIWCCLKSSSWRFVNSNPYTSTKLRQRYIGCLQAARLQGGRPHAEHGFAFRREWMRTKDTLGD